MQILRLQLSGIGPYAGTEDIDFARLGDEGLFLLEGPTGSGKTTVIDAIVFALYGQVAADDSSGDRMVSTHRAPTAEPYVDLVIDTSRGVYRVRRTPQFDRPKRRGTGITTVNATIKLWKLADPDDEVGEPISANIQDANAELRRAIGLTREQFTQTVVLPQGHFANFLRAKPEERRGLLQQIFGTELFEQVQQELVAMAEDYRKKADDLRDEISSLAQRFAHWAWSDNADVAVQSSAGVVALPASSAAAPADGDATTPRDNGTIATAVAPADDGAHPGDGGSETSADPLVDLRERFLAMLGDDDDTALLAAASTRLAELHALHDDYARRVEITRDRVAQARDAQDSARRITELKAEYVALLTERDALDKRREQLSTDQARLDAATRAATVTRPLAAAATTAKALSAATGHWQVIEAEISAGPDASLLEDMHPAQPDQSNAGSVRLRELIEQLSILRGELGQYARLEAGLPARRARIADDNAAVTAIDRQLDAAKDKLEGLHASEDQLAGTVQASTPNDDALGQATMARQAASQVLEAAKSAHRDAEELAELRAAEDHARQAADHAESLYRSTRATWLDGIAGTLAAELTAGDPCPVCGSIEHPSPAHIEDDGATRDQVDELATQSQELAAAATKATAQCDAVALRLAEHTSAAGGLSIEAAQERLDLADAELGDVRAAIAEHTRATAQLEKTRKLITDQHAHIAELTAQRSALEASIATSGEQVAHDEADIANHLDGFPDIAARMRRVSEQLASATKINEAAQSVLSACRDDDARQSEAKQALDEAGFQTAELARAAMLTPEQISELKSSIAAFAEQQARITAQMERGEMVTAVAAPTPDLAALSEDVASAEAEQEHAERSLGAISTRVDQATQVSQELTAAVKSLVRMAPKAAPVLRMAELATGGDRNLSRITLPTYVLRRRFEDVIDQANERLESMTHGRYSLQRTDEKEGRSRKLGLGLVVIDHMPTDTVRQTQTLSGGETFLASLAMALGLSDTVTAEAGGISLDSLFVDEGFGSLDAESLDMVMDQLERLREGGRNVGVVSHVSEMKQRIAERISVRRLPDGSSTLTTTVDG